ncbi:MAG: DUF3606 domain-containing protein [Bradyrhizobiaceae bacterium PARB1]|jgi:Protein of unknown function (DUF3606)|nr:MAG: DUF3606 domain-containing protein [Bradyrhizobiaceae bacterium PARB1]
MNTQSLRPQPARREIDITDAEAMKCWCRHLRATKEEIERAVSTVGPSAAAVRKEIGRKDR